MKIDGPILDYLLDMSVLETLRIPSNQFTGTIPESFGSDHQYLTQVDLSGNNFNGPLPASLGSIIYLQMLLLSKNKFTGKVPAGLGNVTTLCTFLRL
jgi:Leucine-rich repeat (LRR) protein